MTQDSEQVLADLEKSAARLVMQSKKHQLFREKRQEATKQAEVGAIYLRMATLVEGQNGLLQDLREETLAAYYKAAATSLSRAKRLCRDVIRGKED